jgi:hypothetical protein
MPRSGRRKRRVDGESGAGGGGVAGVGGVIEDVFRPRTEGAAREAATEPDDSSVAVSGAPTRLDAVAVPVVSEASAPGGLVSWAGEAASNFTSVAVASLSGVSTDGESAERSGTPS